MKNTLYAFGLIIAFIGNAQAVTVVPTLNTASVTSTTFKFTATLNSPLIKGYSVKVDYGKGLKTMNCSADTCTLLSNSLPVGTTATYKIGIYNGNVPQGSTIDGNYVITSDAVPAPTSGYSKISNVGAVLFDNAELGSNPNDWACTRDNKTGLIWEVKTNDGGLRHKDWTYSWYEPDASKNGGFEGNLDTPYRMPSCGTASNCNTYAYKNTVNAKGLCGAKDWHLPTRDELITLVSCSDGEYNPNGSGCTNYDSVTRPTINTTYFPNTSSDWFWSSSPSDKDINYAWLVVFSYGYWDVSNKHHGDNVRLVH
jgi:hypothetical protein